MTHEDREKSTYLRTPYSHKYEDSLEHQENVVLDFGAAQFMFRAHFPKRKMKAINMCQNLKGYLFGRRVHVLGSSLEEINKSIKANMTCIN